MDDRAANPKRVLVTGSTGAIGEPLAQYLLQRGHTVRGFARRPSPGLDDYVMGDLNDRDKVRHAVEGMDTIVHLGAYPNPADFIEVLLQPNVVGLYNICEAAVEFGVQRLILASTVQVITGHRHLERTITVADGPAPVNHYALDQGLVRNHGRYVRACPQSVGHQRAHRLAAAQPGRGAASWANSPIGPDFFFSHNDSNRFHARCVESPNPPPGQSVILHASSRPAKLERMELEPARRSSATSRKIRGRQGCRLRCRLHEV